MVASGSNYLRWMGPTIGDTFPDLFGETQDSDYFSLYEYLGSKAWGIVFMHPGDFTPVCTTELGAAQSLKAEFDARNTKLCGFSCDDATSHRAWVADIEAATGQRIDFPLFCDPTRMHSIELGVFDPKLKDKAGLPRTVRSVFILNPKKEIELTMTYPSTVGRNFDEILRVLDALQRASNFGVVTPANWQPGDRTIVSYDMDDRKADEKFGKNSYLVADLPSERGQDIKKHCLRYVDDPILTDTKSKQSSKLASRIGKSVRSWKPPKSFPSNCRRRITFPGDTEGSKSNERYSRQSVIDYSQHKPWQLILRGFSTMKQEANTENQGTSHRRRGNSPESSAGRGTKGTDLICDFNHDEESSIEGNSNFGISHRHHAKKRISCNPTGSEIVW